MLFVKHQLKHLISVNLTASKLTSSFRECRLVCWRKDTFEGCRQVIFITCWTDINLVISRAHISWPDDFPFPSPFPWEDTFFVPFPWAETFVPADQESSLLPLDAQLNSSPAVYCQTRSIGDTLCHSSPSVVTSDELVLGMENMDDMWSPIYRPSSTIPLGPSGVKTDRQRHHLLTPSFSCQEENQYVVK